jgi:hypothetical protein
MALAALVCGVACGDSTEKTSATPTGDGGATASSGGSSGPCTSQVPDRDGCAVDGLSCDYADRGDGCPVSYSCTRSLGVLAWSAVGPDDGAACEQPDQQCSYTEGTAGACAQRRVAVCDDGQWKVELESDADCSNGSGGAGGLDDGRGGDAGS